MHLGKAGPACHEAAVLLGQDDQRDQFLTALRAGRMPHAWLLEGPRGLGKRGFADWAAQRLLGGDRDEGGAARLLAAGSHPDFRLLVPPEDGTGAATQSITIAQVTALREEFLHHTPALAAWRVVLIDSADDMNRNAANALLKVLEEPGRRTLFLLVSHRPGSLLPTIRSRCRRLRFRPLPGAAMAPLAAHVPEPQRARLLALARGAPGELQRLLEAEALALLDGMAREPAAVFARQFQPAQALPRFRAFLDLVPRHLAQLAREQRDARLADLHRQAAALASDALPRALDRVQVAHALARLVASAERPGP